MTHSTYYTGSYAQNHWALQPARLEDPNTIALARYGGSQYGVYLNPTDKRGYRCIVCLMDENNMAGTLNRDYTSEERIGLALTVQLVVDVFSRILPVVQTAVAGNNTHSFDAETGTTKLGHKGEPNMLHAHIFARGNPAGEYVPGVALNGPAPGEIFDMRGKTLDVPGNEGKVRWGAGEMEKVTACLKDGIEVFAQTYSKLGVSVQV